MKTQLAPEADLQRKAGATNAGILAVSILANSRPDLRTRLREFRAEQTQKVRQERLP